VIYRLASAVLIVVTLVWAVILVAGIDHYVRVVGR
jgi:hypothetical protein